MILPISIKQYDQLYYDIASPARIHVIQTVASFFLSLRLRLLFTDAETYILGDTDDNGEVEIRDATWIQRQIAEMDLPFEFDNKRADVDDDGNITVMDVTAIQYYLANMKTPYPIGETVS